MVRLLFLVFVLFLAFRPYDAQAQQISYMCAGSPLPEGWVIDTETDYVPGYACPGKIYRIRNTAGEQQLWMCRGSPQPVNWVIDTATTSVSGYLCPGDIYRISNSVGKSVMYMCAGSKLPYGWVIDLATSSVPGYACPGTIYRISDPNNPPPPPAVPKAPLMADVVKNGNVHIVQWYPESDYPEHRNRFALEQSVNGGPWVQVYKGWDRTAWTSPVLGAGTFSYRVKRILPFASSPYSEVVSAVNDGL